MIFGIQIVEYIYNAEKNFEIASVMKIGESTEGRPLLVLKVNTFKRLPSIGLTGDFGKVKTVGIYSRKKCS